MMALLIAMVFFPIKVLKSKWLTTGPFVNQFENEIRKKINSKHCTVVNSATSALHLACISLGLKKGDYIWTSSNTFVSTANCIEHVGAKTDFVDIDEDTYTIDPNRLEDKCKKAKKKGSKFKAVIAIDYAGHPCDWQSLKYLANK